MTPRRTPRPREEPAAPAAPAPSESDGAQPYVEASDWAVGAPVAREPHTPRRPTRGPNVQSSRTESPRRENARDSRRDEPGRDASVVGFGAETPAFLLRAAPVAPLRKLAATDD